MQSHLKMGGFQLFLFIAVFTVSYNVFTAPVESGKLNNRPIIAVIAQRYPKNSNQSYIAASYIKYLETAGARVVPIPHYYTKEKVAELFKYVNGVLYPGGAASMYVSDYYKHAVHFWDMAIEANDIGDNFPVWGTCLGFQAMNVIVSKNEKVLTRRVASDVASALEFTDDGKNARLIKAMPKDIYHAISTEDITYNHHNYGIGPEYFEANAQLKEFFNIISLNKGTYGKKYISTFEAKKYPFYGVQWHPEKHNFEMRLHFKNVPHTANAIRVSQYMSNFFVNEARKSFHKFPTKDMEDKHLIYEYTPVHTALVLKEGSMSHFEQCYIFKE